MIENIDCIGFKRDCGAEPQSVVAHTKLLEHQQACPPCAEFYQSMLALDTGLLGAFTLPVSSSSIDEQLSSVKTAVPNQRSSKGAIFNRFKPWVAAAASVFVVAFGIFAMQYPATAIASDIVEHIYHEPGLLMLTESVTSEEQVKMVLNQANITLSDSGLEILSANLCPLGGQLAAHLVVRGSSGPVTVIIFPEKESRANKIKTKEFNGRILSAEQGLIAVIGGKKEDPAHMEKIVLDAFHWQD